MEFMSASLVTRLLNIAKRESYISAEKNFFKLHKFSKVCIIPANSSKSCDSRLKHVKKEQLENECN